MKHLLFALLVACAGCDGCATVHDSDSFSTEYCGDLNPEIEKRFKEKIAEMEKKPFGKLVIRRETQGNCHKIIVARQADYPESDEDETDRIEPIKPVDPITPIEPIEPIKPIEP